MSASRAVIPRMLQLNLSTRYQYLRRINGPTGSRPTSTVSQPPPRPNFFRRNRTNAVWSALALVSGVVGGQFVVHTISPPPLPDADTREDGILIADLNKRIDEESLVQDLRRMCIDMSIQLKGEGDGWLEVLSNPLELLAEKSVQQGLVARMEGAKGMGVERVFWHKADNNIVAVIWLGGSLCGWPGVIHGGAVAIALAEKLSMAAALANNGNSDALAAATPQQLPGTGNHAKMLSPATAPNEPAQLSMRYVKPTYANQFFVIRVVPVGIEHLDPKNFVDNVVSKEIKGSRGYEAKLETIEGKACAVALATFASDTATRQRPDKSDRAKLSVVSFREWIWPSRQQLPQTNP